MPSQVSSKRGDRGTTVTLGGDELAKSHPVLECCGEVDAVRAETALCRLLLLESGRSDAAELADFMMWVLHAYFLIGTACNDPEGKNLEIRQGEISSKHVERVEKMQSQLENGLDLPKNFIVSASNPLAAHIDVLCTRVRRLERSVVGLRESVPDFEAGGIIAFLNRLSDLFFVMARHLEDGVHISVDYEAVKDT